MPAFLVAGVAAARYECVLIQYIHD